MLYFKGMSNHIYDEQYWGICVANSYFKGMSNYIYDELFKRGS